MESSGQPSSDLHDVLVVVGCYNRFDKLAHQPKGTPAKHSIRIYRFCQETGTLMLLSLDDTLENPAFFRYHPSLNIFYCCSEDITKDNSIAAFAVSPATGKLTHIGTQSAMGKSTCYLTIDCDSRHLLFVNYWDSVIGSIALTPSGKLGPVVETLAPPTPVVARHLEDHLNNRQSEPHAHAIVLDPYFSKVAFVPDLGENNIKQLFYDREKGKLVPSCSISCCRGTDDEPCGPRYIVFHPTLNCVYVVNELSSMVSVFYFNLVLARDMVAGSTQSTLELVQSINTIPAAFPREMNTCGRICVHPKGFNVFVSNRGHDSIAIFNVNKSGTLALSNIVHTRGKCPRHFQFDPSGEFMLAANQDSDTITVFRFDHDTGNLKFTGEMYDCPSPNFVCIRRPVMTKRCQKTTP